MGFAFQWEDLAPGSFLYLQGKFEEVLVNWGSILQRNRPNPCRESIYLSIHPSINPSIYLCIACDLREYAA
jgi:hypothetical protein